MASVTEHIVASDVEDGPQTLEQVIRDDVICRCDITSALTSTKMCNWLLGAL